MRARGRELRKAKRTPRRNAASILLDGGGTPIPCVLWDISEGGARIAAPRVNALPDVFGLLVGKDPRARRFCRVVWRREGQLGIRFIDESAADIDLDPSPRRSRQRKPATAASPAPKAARPGEVTIEQLVLPGCAPRAEADTERRPLALSSVALIMLLLLVAATALFAFAGMQGDAAWMRQLCDSTQNFCQHPEWTGAASVAMMVVYLAVKGMER
jgi:hypothetical protein